MGTLQPPKGTRDILYEEASARRKVIGKLRECFLRFGFSDLETPSMENMETLARKSGPEVEKQIYSFDDKGGRKLGLIFEFTASLGRVAASSPQIIRPFKRYQIGKVWRYENPQSNRYREFCQADVDIIGPRTMDCEAEILLLVATALRDFGLKDFSILLNNRKLLRGQLETAGITEQAAQDAVLRGLDKLDKVGRDAVREYVVSQGIAPDAYDGFLNIVPAERTGGNDAILADAEARLRGNALGAEGLAEIREILRLTSACGVADHIRIDPFLVRGLGYYTGPIFEVRSAAMGDVSFGGGGRYDGMVEAYGGAPAGAVGFAFGVERLVSVLTQHGLVKGAKSEARIMIATAGPAMAPHAFALASELRAAGIPVYQYVGDAKLAKQFSFASKMDFSCVAVVGEREMEAGVLRVKDLASGRELDIPRNEAADRLRQYASPDPIAG
jgi:histidyl-tRNA synthetase